MRHALLSALLPLLALTACIETGLTPAPAEKDQAFLSVSPSHIDFRAAIDGTEILTVAVTNESEVGANLFLDGNLEDFAVLNPREATGEGLWLDGMSSSAFDIAFSPTNPEPSEGLLVFSSPDLPDLEVSLEGRVLLGELDISPSPLDFGEIGVGQQTILPVSISNTGEAKTNLTSWNLEGQGFYLPFAPAESEELEPGEVLEFEVAFAPTQEGAFNGSLEVTWSEGTTATALIGSAAPPPRPIAVCQGSPNPAEPFDLVTFSAVGSHDPGGSSLTYQWSPTSLPIGSQANLASLQPQFSILPELAGTYSSELTVTNTAGDTSETCTASVQVVPSEDLWIELTWTLTRDDLDLHLIGPGGTAADLNHGVLDCYYYNCQNGLEWGQAGPIDDPFLDQDDISGIGPENINIAVPSDGAYTVVVHDYDGYDSSTNLPTALPGANYATVKIYLAGALAWEDTRLIVGEDYAEEFAQVVWTGSGAVMPR